MDLPAVANLCGEILVESVLNPRDDPNSRDWQIELFLHLSSAPLITHHRGRGSCVAAICYLLVSRARTCEAIP